MDAFVRRLGSSRPRAALSDISNASGALTEPSEPPTKRLKRDECEQKTRDHDVSDDEDTGDTDGEAPSGKGRRWSVNESLQVSNREVIPDSDDDFEDEQRIPVRHHETALETALPHLLADDEAIKEYESGGASKESVQQIEGHLATDVGPATWIKGKKSIYVDAFNLALDTVLEEESHLFDEQENAVFQQWRALEYECQYLYVRLFLRKTAAWHRQNRLGYHSDISDPDHAIAALQQLRHLPRKPLSADAESDASSVAGIPLQAWLLGDNFTFADSSEDYITSVDEAAALLSLDELKALAREAKVQGGNKAEILKRLLRVSSQQSGLMAVGLKRQSTNGSADPREHYEASESPEPDRRQDSNRNQHFLSKILAITGPCIRVSPSVFKLFERVHLVFYRSMEWTEKSLTTIILAKISRRNFPPYIVDRTTNIFPNRRALLEFEQAMRLEFEIDQILEFNGPPGAKGFRRVLEVFDGLKGRWRQLLEEEGHKDKTMYDFGEGGYLRRFNAAHAYTRIAHKAAYVYGRLHEYSDEYSLLSECLGQRLFQMARRGSWYQRKALLEEHYMFEVDPSPRYTDAEQQKKHWRRIAVATCESALEDRDCHLIYHYDLQKRLNKLEKKLRIPKRLQHDFGHVRLQKPEEHFVSGVQLKKDVATTGKRRGVSTKTIWMDSAEGGGECSVEAMCLSHYRSQGWKGYHAEGGILRTLFAYLFYDVLFLYVPNVFQTAYQTCPLDLHTDSFFPTRASEVNHRLVLIANGDAPRIIQEVDAAHREARTCIVGLNWDYVLEDLVELASCFRGDALAAICKVMAQEYQQRGGGVPDLVLWRTEPKPECMFGEVKSANDRLSDTQRLWIHVLTGAGVRVALVNAVAEEVRYVD
ncbi:coiled-coil domain-containing protein MTMR15 [Coniella lustricola]|uniref:Fanconi-associated nuclease n=1 Tax=Coniella lustricola TaxID=2025994 RepID=A0A2T3A3M6_9PEZI|nr:coiled-coil domain-containing protein MTMR15 [Coniella lustricola]